MLTCHSLNFLVFRKTQPFSGVEIDLPQPSPIPPYLTLTLPCTLHYFQNDNKQRVTQWVCFIQLTLRVNMNNTR